MFTKAFWKAAAERAVKAFTYEEDKANVLVLDGHGRILKRLAGAADESSVRELCETLEAALNDPANKAGRK